MWTGLVAVKDGDGLGYAGVVRSSCTARKAVAAAALDLRTRIRERRPEVITQVRDRRLTVPQVSWQAYECDDLAAYRD